MKRRGEGEGIEKADGMRRRGQIRFGRLQCMNFLAF